MNNTFSALYNIRRWYTLCATVTRTVDKKPKLCHRRGEYDAVGHRRINVLIDEFLLLSGPTELSCVLSAATGRSVERTTRILSPYRLNDKQARCCSGMLESCSLIPPISVRSCVPIVSHPVVRRSMIQDRRTPRGIPPGRVSVSLYLSIHPLSRVSPWYVPATTTTSATSRPRGRAISPSICRCIATIFLLHSCVACELRNSRDKSPDAAAAAPPGDDGVLSGQVCVRDSTCNSPDRTNSDRPFASIPFRTVFYGHKSDSWESMSNSRGVRCEDAGPFSADGLSSIRCCCWEFNRLS